MDMNQAPGFAEQGPLYEPTQEGFGLALDSAVARFADAIEARQGTPGYNDDGKGQALVLYPDALNARETVTISAVGNSKAERVLTPGAQFQVTHETGKRDDMTVHRVSGSVGSRIATQLGNSKTVKGALSMEATNAATYADLIEAIKSSSPIKPEKAKTNGSGVKRALGWLARKN